MAKFKHSPNVEADREHKKLCIVVPAADIEAARDIAIDYINKTVPHTTDNRNDMLPIKLSKTGQEPVTHYLCFGNFDAAELDNMANRISSERAKGKTFCDTRKRAKTESSLSMTGLFSVIDCTKDELLLKTGLKEIK